MTAFKKGHKPMGRALPGHITLETTKKLIGRANTGKKRTQEFKDGISKRFLGIKKSEEHRKKISISHIGKTVGSANGMKKKEVREKHLLKTGRGHTHPNWKGGLSFEPYTIDWNETLKRSIRERDQYTCRICGKPQGDKSHDVHHIDYDKTNCSPFNLITLCVSCHAKTNYNRDYWKDYFNNI